MSIRWRATGEMLCAAKCEVMEGDTYIDDRLHYQLSVISKCIVADADHEHNGLWYWVHSKIGDKSDDYASIFADALNHVFIRGSISKGMEETP